MKNSVDVQPSFQSPAPADEDAAEAVQAERLVQLDAVGELSLRALEDVSIERFVSEVAQRVAEVLNLDQCQIWRLAADGQALSLAASTRKPQTPAARPQLRLDSKASQVTYTLDTSHVVVLDGWKGEYRFAPSPAVGDADMQGGLSVVVPGRQKPFGVLVAHSRAQRRFPAHDLQFVRSIATLLSGALERHGAEVELRLSEERFRLLVNSVRDYAIYTLDPEGRVETWNEGAKRIKGYTADEIIGQPYEVFYPSEAQAAGKPALELESAVAHGSYEEEGIRVRKDGSRFWAHVVLTAVRDPAGRLLGFTKVTQDIGERRRSDEERQRNLAELERSNRELQTFAVVASHDLQEPLRKIQMFGDRLRAQFAGALGAEGIDYIERMQRAGARGQALIQGLLAYSRITTRAQPPVPVALSQVVQDVLSDLEPRLMQVGGKVEVGELPTLEADALQMRQLLQNLVGNALKYHQAGIPPHIQVRATPVTSAASAWRLEVEDNGIGFEERYLDRIFNLFQRLHERGAYEGTGMGLAICRKIVERHGGTITARSYPGTGSTFIVELPAKQAAPSHSAMENAC